MCSLEETTSPAPGEGTEMPTVGEGWISSLVSPPPTSPCQQSTVHFFFRKKMLIERSAKRYPVLPSFSFSSSSAFQWLQPLPSNPPCALALPSTRWERLLPCLCCVEAEMRHQEPQSTATARLNLLWSKRGELWVKDSLPQHWFNTVKCQSCGYCVVFTGSGGWCVGCASQAKCCQ